MLKIKFSYADKEFYLTPYNTILEKDLLILETFDEVDPRSALHVLGMQPNETKDLTLEEQIALLLAYRSISVGEEIPIKYKCKACGQPNESMINCENNIFEPETDIKINQKFKEVTHENLHEFVDYDLEEMDIDEYNKLFEEVKRSAIKFIFTKETKCMSCSTTNVIDIGEKDKILSYMSEDSLASLYKQYSDLIFYSHYTKQDVDSMLPFERTIFIGLLNATREEIAE